MIPESLYSQYGIDEDALRMEIMKEMLEESKAKGKDAGKKRK